MTILDSFSHRVRKSWPVLKQAQLEIGIIAFIALAAGAYGAFWLTNYVLRGMIETQGVRVEALKQTAEDERKAADKKYSELQARYDAIQKKTQGVILLGYGGPIGTCSAVIDGTRLIDFQDKYGVAIVCGTADSSTDKYTDDRITVSPLHTIRKETIPITVDYRSGTQAAHEKIADKFRLANKLPKGTPVNVPKWYEVVLLPKGTDPATIHRLTDVTQYGGKLLSQEGFLMASTGLGS